MAPEPEPPAIKFVGLVVREADGTVRAVDLSGEDLWLKVAVDIPIDDGGIVAFGLDSTYRHVGLPERIDIKVTGHRRFRATPGALATMRTVPAGEPPFPALSPAVDEERSNLPDSPGGAPSP